MGNRGMLKIIIMEEKTVTYWGEPVVSIGNSAFASKQLTSVTIPNSVTSIGNSVFYYNRLTGIRIGANVIMGSNTFESAVSGSFEAFYTSNGKKAGTYTSINGRWSYSEW